MTGPLTEDNYSRIVDATIKILGGRVLHAHVLRKEHEDGSTEEYHFFEVNKQEMRVKRILNDTFKEEKLFYDDGARRLWEQLKQQHEFVYIGKT